MNDAELIALAALAKVEAVLMAGDNREAEMNGWLPPWRTGTGMMNHSMALMDELARRAQVKGSQ